LPNPNPNTNSTNNNIEPIPLPFVAKDEVHTPPNYDSIPVRNMPKVTAEAKKPPYPGKTTPNPNATNINNNDFLPKPLQRVEVKIKDEDSNPKTSADYFEIPKVKGMEKKKIPKENIQILKDGTSPPSQSVLIPTYQKPIAEKNTSDKDTKFDYGALPDFNQYGSMPVPTDNNSSSSNSQTHYTAIPTISKNNKPKEKPIIDESKREAAKKKSIKVQLEKGSTAVAANLTCQEALVFICKKRNLDLENYAFYSIKDVEFSKDYGLWDLAEDTIKLLPKKK